MQVPLHDQMMLEVKSTLSPVTASETGGILDDWFFCGSRNTDDNCVTFWSATIMFKKNIQKAF